MDDEVAEEESYRQYLIDNCPNLKVRTFDLLAIAIKGGDFLLLSYALFY